MFSLFRPANDPEAAPPPRDRSLSTRLAWLLLIPLFFFAAWMTYFTLYNILHS